MNMKTNNFSLVDFCKSSQNGFFIIYQITPQFSAFSVFSILFISIKLSQIIILQNMNQLFTFNSKQFQSIHPNQTNKQSINFPSSQKNNKKQGNSSEFSHDNHNYLNLTQKISPKETKQNNSIFYKEEISMRSIEPSERLIIKKRKNFDFNQQQISQRYSKQLVRNNGEQQLTKIKNKNEQTLNKINRNPSKQSQSHKKQRIQSVKMNPRIFLPQSDRKLPKTNLPPILRERKPKYESFSERQVHSANYSRCDNFKINCEVLGMKDKL